MQSCVHYGGRPLPRRRNLASATSSMEAVCKKVLWWCRTAGAVFCQCVIEHEAGYSLIIGKLEHCKSTLVLHCEPANTDRNYLLVEPLRNVSAEHRDEVTRHVMTASKAKPQSVGIGNWDAQALQYPLVCKASHGNTCQMKINIMALLFGTACGLHAPPPAIFEPSQVE